MRMCKLCAAYPVAEKEAPSDSKLREYIRPDTGFRPKGLQRLSEYLADGNESYVWNDCLDVVRMSTKELESLKQKVDIYHRRLNDTLTKCTQVLDSDPTIQKEFKEELNALKKEIDGCTLLIEEIKNLTD